MGATKGSRKGRTIEINEREQRCKYCPLYAMATVLGFLLWRFYVCDFFPERLE